MAGKKQHMAPVWKNLMKNVDLDEPTSFFDHVYSGCTQRECKPNDNIIEEHTKKFESCIFCCTNRKSYLKGKNLAQKSLAWSYDMEGHAPKVCGKMLRTGKKRNSSICTKFQVLA